MNVTIPSGKFELSAVIKDSSGSKKLAVLLPGFLDSKDYAHMVGLEQDLSKIGFTTVRFDPTGTWESSGTINDYSFTQYLSDVTSVINFMDNVSGGGKVQRNYSLWSQSWWSCCANICFGQY